MYTNCYDHEPQILPNFKNNLKEGEVQVCYILTKMGEVQVCYIIMKKVRFRSVIF